MLLIVLASGLTAAFAYGILQLVVDPYIISVPQMLVDYLFAFGALGLSGLFSKYDDGLFLIRINFTPEDVQVPIEKEVLNYIVEKGQIYKPVFLSNLGLTVKTAQDLTYVFVTDI